MLSISDVLEMGNAPLDQGVVFSQAMEHLADGGIHFDAGIQPDVNDLPAKGDL